MALTQTQMIGAALALGAVAYLAYQKEDSGSDGLSGGGLPAHPLKEPRVMSAMYHDTPIPEEVETVDRPHRKTAGGARTAQIGAGVGDLAVKSGVRVIAPKVTVGPTGIARNEARDIVITPEMQQKMALAQTTHRRVFEEVHTNLDRMGIIDPGLRAKILEARREAHEEFERGDRVSKVCMPLGRASEILAPKRDRDVDPIVRAIQRA